MFTPAEETARAAGYSSGKATFRTKLSRALEWNVVSASEGQGIRGIRDIPDCGWGGGLDCQADEGVKEPDAVA